MAIGRCVEMTGAVLTGGIELLEQLSPPWRQLCGEGGASEPFNRPEWIAAYLRAFEPPDRQLCLVSAWSGDRLTAALPLVAERAAFCGIPARKLRGAANVFSGRFDLACCRGPEAADAVNAVWNCLKDRLEWDVIEMPDVPEGGAAESLLDRARKDGFPTGQWETNRSPYIALAGSGAAPHDAHFRQNLRRRLRKAEARWPVRLTRYDTADPAVLERFYSLEASGWKGRDNTAIACDGATRRFHDDIASAAERFGYLSLYFLEFGDQLAAAHFGLTYQGRYYIPKVAYDERLAAYGPGHLLIDAVLHDLIHRGIREFDFLGPWMDWKGEWTREVRRHANCYIFRPGVFGQGLYLAKCKVAAALRTARQPGIASLRRLFRGAAK